MPGRRLSKPKPATTIRSGIESMRARVKIDLRFVNSFEDRHGRWRYYFRRKGQKAVPLPDPHDQTAFTGAYNACLEAEKPEPEIRSKKGTLAALREEYLRSAEWADLRDSTKREYGYVLDALCREIETDGRTRGEKVVAGLQRKNILGWRDKMKDKPGAANKMMRVVKRLMSFAVDRGYRDDNPALKIKLMKGGEYRDWTDAECLQFEQHWAIGTRERLGYALGLYTLQRLDDVASMAWTKIAGEKIKIKQGKGGVVMNLPIHPELAKCLREVHPRNDTIIASNVGDKLNSIYFGKVMADAIGAAGLPDDCVFHGLRKTGARILEELGHRPRSMTGHLTVGMEQHYSKRADQTRNAEAAILAWAERDRNKKGKSQTAKSRVTNLRKKRGAP